MSRFQAWALKQVSLMKILNGIFKPDIEVKVAKHAYYFQTNIGIYSLTYHRVIFNDWKLHS